jgi:catechol 2,3-dioxygenase-like lactoylglutathione lyase family enzyme
MADRPLLGAIRAVTTCVTDLDRVVQVYEDWLGYRPVERGEVPPAAASGWRAPACAGRRYATLAPESGEACYLRFIESEQAEGWSALTTHGWNATEIVVQDVDALSARLSGSPDFTIIGEVMPLGRFSMIRAMQVLGPAGECLYFTEVGPGSGLTLAPALSFVGRVFIVVAGGPDLRALFEAYGRFDNSVDPPVSTPVRVVSRANGLDPETPIAHGLVRLGRGTLIELDGYPPQTRPRRRTDGELPPGMAMVSFDVSRLEGGTTPALLPSGGHSQTLVGAAGEWIELVEGAQ